MEMGSLYNRKDIKGRRFGRLTVLEETGARDNKHSVIWKCRCDCGKTVEVGYDALVYGNTVSCGCRKKEWQDNLFQTLNYQDHTSAVWLEKRKYRSDNTTGFRGVTRRKSGRYSVNIGFQQKRYYVGTYDTYDEAVAVRKKAEDLIHGGYLRACGRRQEEPPDGKEDAGGRLIYRIVKGDGFLRIESNDKEEDGNRLEF